MLPPHEVPAATVRVQLWVPVVFVEPHAPAAHVYVVTLRLCVPEVSHALEKLPHAPQPPYTVAPHDTPSVAREHACVSVDGAAAHWPIQHRFYSALMVEASAKLTTASCNLLYVLGQGGPQHGGGGGSGSGGGGSVQPMQPPAPGAGSGYNGAPIPRLWSESGDAPTDIADVAGSLPRPPIP